MYIFFEVKLLLTFKCTMYIPDFNSEGNFTAFELSPITVDPMDSLNTDFHERSTKFTTDSPAVNAV